MTQTEKNALHFVGRLIAVIIYGGVSFVMFGVLWFVFEDPWGHRGADGKAPIILQYWAAGVYLWYALGLILWLVKDYDDRSYWHLLVVWFPILIMGYLFWLHHIGYC